MRIELDKSLPAPLYQQLADQLCQLIHTGVLLPGDRLPPERGLAEELGINRTTVLSAYRALKDLGLAESHVGYGTVVTAAAEDDESGLQPREPEWNHLFSAYGNRIRDDALSELLGIANRDDVISFAAGIACHDSGPLTDLQRIVTDLLKHHSRQSLMLSPVEGFHSLRAAIAEQMATRGCHVLPEEILVLSGSQQGIDLVARILLDPGDVVVVEEPTYFPALQIFRALGARVIGVGMDRGGMRIDSLEQILQRHRPKLIYTMPTFHNPTGCELSTARRQRLVELTAQYKVPLLEDDAYGSFDYEGHAEPPLKSLDESGYCIYLSTFTKMIYPGIRVGWVAAPQALVRRLCAARQTEDLHTNSLAQRIVEQFLAAGQLARHLKEIRRTYRNRRDRMLSALDEYAPSEMDWTHPNGGYYVWCTLPQGIRAERLLPVAARKGVAFVPGNRFYPGEGGEHSLRLTFTFAPEDAIRPGIKILCDCIRELAQAQQTERDNPITEITPVL